MKQFVHLKNVRLCNAVERAQIADMTQGFSGADLANLVNEAALPRAAAQRQ